MKRQGLEMGYCTENEIEIEAHTLFRYNDKFESISILYNPSSLTRFPFTLVHNDVWYAVQDISSLSEEEQFQLSVVWNCPFEMNFIDALQVYVKNDKDNWYSTKLFDLTLEY